MEIESKLVEANTNTATEFMCNTFSVALSKRKNGKFRPKFNSFPKPENIYACELGAWPSVNFPTNKISEDKTQGNRKSLDSIW